MCRQEIKKADSLPLSFAIADWTTPGTPLIPTSKATQKSRDFVGAALRSTFTDSDGFDASRSITHMPTFTDSLLDLPHLRLVRRPSGQLLLHLRISSQAHCKTLSLLCVVLQLQVELLVIAEMVVFYARQFHIFVDKVGKVFTNSFVPAD